MKKILMTMMLMLGLHIIPAYAADEAPDVLVKRISQDVLDSAKNDKDINAGNRKKIQALVESKVFPYVDFQRITSLAVGRGWREATPEQQKILIAEFRNLLMYTYSGAIAQVRDQRIDFKPLRASDTENEVIVRSQVVQPRGGDPIQLNYRLTKTANGWKIYDLNVLGAWLVETYKGSFAQEMNKSGVDGLIKVLIEKNKSLAAKSA